MISGADGMTNLSGVTAVDVHVHATISAWSNTASATRDAPLATIENSKQGQRLFPDEIAEYYRARNMMAVLFPLDSSAVLGTAPVPNDEVMEAGRKHPDVIIPFASVDPWRGVLALEEASRLIDEGTVRGFKFHPGTQAFYPNDPRHYPLFRLIEDAGLVALFHTGQTAVGQGRVRLKYGNPMLIDDLAVDCPKLKIIMAHPSVPWQDEAIAIAGHKPNVYIDLSGWLPKYFPTSLVHSANRMLKRKVLFGSDFPMLTPDAWLESFHAMDFRDDVRELILRDNAIELFGLSSVLGGTQHRHRA